MTVLAGKTIWLIGASTGIGESLTHVLAERGARLIVSARSAEKLQALLQSLPADDHRAVALDVTDPASVAQGWDQVSAAGLPDMVIYNAGAYDPLGAKEFDLKKIEAMANVNFNGALRVLSHFLPPFLVRNSGCIVLVGSVAGYSGLPNALGYGASKAAIIHLAENLRADLVMTAVRVQLVSPGFVKTRLTAKNNFAMPFILEPRDAARRIADGIESERFEIAFPKRLVWILKTLRLLPYELYFTLLRKLKIAG